MKQLRTKVWITPHNQTWAAVVQQSSVSNITIASHDFIKDPIRSEIIERIEQ